MPFTVALVCDSDFTCCGMKEMLAHAPDIALTGQFTSLAALDDYLRQNALDVVLLDDALPQPDWFEGTAHLADAYPALRIIVLGRRTNVDHVQMVMGQGAHGFICIGEPQLRDTLLQGIQWVCQTDDLYLSPGVAARFYIQPVATRPVRLAPCEHASLSGLADGKTAQQIAAQRGCKDANPIYGACRRARKKLGAKTNEEAISIAIKLGLIKPSGE